MTNVIDVVNSFEENVQALREQKESLIPEFSIYGEDCINIDIPCIIENIENFREGAVPECVEHFNSIIEHFKKIQEIISDKNSLIAERNEIIQFQVNDLQEAFTQQISNEPEMKFNKVLRISCTKIDEKYHPVIDSVISALGFTNFESVAWRYKIYLDIDSNPKVRDSVIAEFHKKCFELNLEKFEKFKDFVQLEPIDTSYIQNAIEAIKSRI